MRKCKDLYDKSQFFFGPEIAFHDFLNKIRVDFPDGPGEFPVKFEKPSDFLRVLFLGNPFNVSTGFKEFGEHSINSVDRTKLGTCNEGEEVGNFGIDKIVLEEFELQCLMLLKICRIEEQEALKVGDAAFFDENGIKKLIEVGRNLIHDKGRILWGFSLQKVS